MARHASVRVGPRSRSALTAGSLVVAFAFVLAGMVLLVRPLTLLDQQPSVNPISINIALTHLSGQNVPTDFQVDYASALALRRGGDPYQISETLFRDQGLLEFPVSTANPHPPTLVVAVIPFTWLSYPDALAAWSVLMLFLVAGTLRLMGLPWAVAAAVAVGVAGTFPGAYAIANPVPAIGFGVALAYRYRDRPLIAGLGIATATLPKISGIVLVVPFLLATRWRPCLWSIGALTATMGLAVWAYPGILGTYLSAGVRAGVLTSERGDNGSLFHLAAEHQVPGVLVLLALGAVAVAITLVSRGAFWASNWLMVAALPIAWMYSMLTLLPLVVRALGRSNRWGQAAAALAAALTLVSPPFRQWPTVIIPLVVLAAAVAALATPDDEFTVRLPPFARLVRPRRLDDEPAAAPSEPPGG